MVSVAVFSAISVSLFDYTPEALVPAQEGSRTVPGTSAVAKAYLPDRPTPVRLYG
jgi:hypothetical protein